MKKCQLIDSVKHLEFVFDDKFHEMSVKDCRSFLQNTLKSFKGLKYLTIKREVEYNSCTDLIQGSEKLIGLYGYEGYISELFNELYRGMK